MRRPKQTDAVITTTDDISKNSGPCASGNGAAKGLTGDILKAKAANGAEQSSQAKRGLFDTNLKPNEAAIRQHLELIAAPARRTHPDALIEIAYDSGAYGEKNHVTNATLFGLEEIDKAVAFVVEANAKGRRNVYVGVTLKKPDTPRAQRTNDDDCYVATCMAAEADKDVSAVHARISKMGVEVGARVVTGHVPELREHIWTQLAEPCADLAAFGRGFKSFAAHIGADTGATGMGRVLRLAGTLSYPPGKKRDKGYIVELTTLTIDKKANPTPLDAFLNLDPLDAAEKPHEPRQAAGRVIGPPTPTGKFMTDVNATAMWNLPMWVPKLFGQDARPCSHAEDGYRISSEALCRDLEEDLSINAKGIKDFGVADQGDPREGKRTPIDVVMEWSELYGRTLDDGRPPNTPELAARWLCERLGIDVDIFKQWLRQHWVSKQHEGLGREVVEQDGVLIDKETGEVIMSAPREKEPDAPSPVADYVAAILSRPGLVRDIADHILSRSRRPQPALAVVAALLCVGTAAGRQMRTPTDATLNLYQLLVGPTGCGKDTPQKATDALFDAAGLGKAMVHNNTFKSDVSIYSHAYGHPVSVAIVDEFGDIVKATNARNAPSSSLGVMTTLRIFWDGKTVSAPKALSRPPMTLREPCLSLLCASTEEQFYSSVGNAEVLNGFLNRFLIAYAGKAPRSRPSGRVGDVPKELAQRLRQIADLPGGDRPWRYREKLTEESPALPSKTVEWADASVEEAWEAYEDECVDKQETNPRRAQLGPRCAHNCIKIATILAIGDNPHDPAVTMEHFEIGKALVEDSLRRMMKGYAEHETETPETRLRDKIIERIREAGGIIAKRQLVRHVQVRMTSFNDVIEMLVESGRLEALTKKPKGGGHDAIHYRLLD